MGTYSFSTDRPITVALGPHQYAYGWRGDGITPIRIDTRDGSVVDCGIDPPTLPSTKSASGWVTRGENLQYYIARIDVINGGEQYFFPPELTITPDPDDVSSYCKYNTYLNRDSLGGVKIIDGGRGYLAPPVATVTDTYGQDVALTAELENGSVSTDGSIQSYYLIQQCLSAPCTEYLQPVNVDGKAVNLSTSLPEDPTEQTDEIGNKWLFKKKVGNLLTYQYTMTSSWDDSGSSGSSGEAPVGATPITLEFTFNFVNAASGSTSIFYPVSLIQDGVKFIDRGTGWWSNKPAVVMLSATSLGAYEIPDQSRCKASGTRPMIIELYTGDNPNSPTNKYLGGALYPIKSVSIDNPGQQYVGQPLIKVSNTNGDGAVLRARINSSVSDARKQINVGWVEMVEIISGGLYSEPPDLAIDSGGAEVNVISRPHLRGVYQCYTRFVDRTPESRGGPIPSNLSELTEFDANEKDELGEQREGAGSITWSVPVPPVREDGRLLDVEIWRSTSNQATTLYRVATIDGTTVGETTTYVDDLTDEELASPDREEFLAMPILLANGELNANRFGIPEDVAAKAVAVMFQDRLWVAGDTSDTEPNSLYYSEVDEPEAIPEVNQLVLQNNDKSQDHITALAPFGSHLAVFQTHRYHRLSYVAQPIIDANVQVAAYRGCCNQRCWDSHQGTLFVMDTEGLYSVDSSGSLNDISTPISDIFTDKIDWETSQWFSVQCDYEHHVVRASVRFKGDGEGIWPTRQLVFSFLTQGWSEYRYPQSLVGTASLRHTTGEMFTIAGSSGNSLIKYGGRDTDICYLGIGSVVIEQTGSGYIHPPKITAVGGEGAIIDCSIDDRGRVHKVFIRHAGYGFLNESDNPATLIVEASPTGDNAQLSPVIISGRVIIPCAAKTGNMEYELLSNPTRDIDVLYSPTKEPSDLNIVTYYNNYPYGRNNIVQRERGDGVIYEESTPLSSINTYEKNLPPQLQNGVASAHFMGVTDPAIKGNDRHIAVEVRAERGENAKPVVHSINVVGVVGGE